MKEIRVPGVVIPSGYDLEIALQSVGKGWEPLIRQLFEDKPKTIEIEQVKEKFGCLRVYTDYHHEEYSKVIMVLESLSCKICETCGKAGSADTSMYWILTLCDEHKKERADKLKLRS